MTDSKVILASGSPYRKALLQRLVPAFETRAPDVDESPLDNESPADLAGRLSLSKAGVISDQFPQALVVAGDQVAELEGQAIGKPHTIETAMAQLAACSGRTVTFHSGVVVQRQSDSFIRQHVDITRVSFRRLDRESIADYLAREPALDCAGSFRAEGLGISLLSSISSEDPTGIIGLPLIWLASALRAAGLSLGSEPG